jgi:hypothetical protein
VCALLTNPGPRACQSQYYSVQTAWRPLEQTLCCVALLEAAPVTTIEFERFLTSARHALRETASGHQSHAPSDIAALEFYASLARQCFINEYIFDCGDSVPSRGSRLPYEVTGTVGRRRGVPPFLLLAVAAYFPLYTLRDAVRPSRGKRARPNCRRAAPTDSRTARRAGTCARASKRLTSIAGGVSKDVRDQYELNPYPRWVKLPMPRSDFVLQ